MLLGQLFNLAKRLNTLRMEQAFLHLKFRARQRICKNQTSPVEENKQRIYKQKKNIKNKPKLLVFRIGYPGLGVEKL